MPAAIAVAVRHATEHHRRPGRRPGALMTTVAVAIVGACSLLPLYALDRESATAFAGMSHLIALVAAGILLLRSAGSADPAMRRSRLLFAGSLGVSAAGSVIGLGYVVRTGAVPVPSLADAVTPLWAVLAAWGFWLVPMREGQRRSLSRMLSDGLVAASALLLSSYLLVIEPLHDSGRWSPLGEAVQIIYPLMDIFIAAVVLSILPRARADLRPFLNCVAFGLLLVGVADSGWAHMLALEGALTFGWQDLIVQGGLVVLIRAAMLRPSPDLAEQPIISRKDSALPFVPVMLAVGVALWHVANIGAFGLYEVILAAAMTLAILFRQLIYTSDLARVAEVYRHAACHDALTGLPNRMSFLGRLSEHLSTPGAPPAVVLLLDLDGFKDVNDTLGHEAGDELLIEFGRRVVACAPAGTVARLGGDEFAVLLPETGKEPNALDVARLLAEIWVGTVSGIRVTCSVGMAPMVLSDTTSEALRRADLAMYAAKLLPQPRFAVFSPELATTAERRSSLLAQLAGAVERGEMYLHYQPLYRLSDGAVSGAEALLRWNSPQFGNVPPDEFIPLAEDSGDIVEIGLWVLATALAQVAAWQRQGCYLPQLFVNAAASQFDDRLADEVMALLAKHDLDPGRLTVEITETQIPGLTVNSAIKRLRECGVHVAIDDFGSGYSSLAQIAHLPVDVLKIDREFILDLSDGSGRPILDAVVSLARALGLTTVAEGIEDTAQADQVADAGVDFAQGFLFSRPMPPDQLTPALHTIPLARRETQIKEVAILTDRHIA